MTHKAPYRPTGDVTQSFNDGILTVYSETDEARPGYKPKAVKKEKYKLRYEEQKLGIQRRFLGLQNQIKIERVVRVPKAEGITTQDVAQTEDGQSYRISLIQKVPNAFPPCIDLSLELIAQDGEIK